MKRTAPAAILLATGLIAGCSTSEPLKNADFQSVVASKTDTPTLEVPPDLTAPQIQNKYVIPANGTALASQVSQEQKAATQTSPQTAAIAVAVAAATAGNAPQANSAQTIKMVRAGSQRWLEVSNKSPAELWPQLKAFWQDNGFTIKTEEPEVGVMDTDWAENRAALPNDMIHSFLASVGLEGAYSTGQRDMFHIRLEKTDNGGSEVYFSHQGVQEVYTTPDKSQTSWEPSPVNQGLEAEMLTRFMIRMGTPEKQAQQAVAQAQAPSVAQANPVNNGSLTINDNFDRAWRRVGLALDRIGLVVSDRDRSQGIYFVKPAENEVDNSKPASSSGGFWSKLWPGHGSKPAASPSADNSLRVLVKESTPGNTSITITDSHGQLMTNSFAKNALTQLQGELQ
jgi:outer membrane protein assembly factor BamC